MLKALTSLLLFCMICFASNAQQANNSAVLSRRQIPILCYHQIREWKAKDKPADKDYIIPPATFAAQVKLLADSGYHAILPDELCAYLETGKPLPPKPIMLTFDDTMEDQFRVARPELMKYHFKAVYFIVTSHIGTHKYYMDRQQIKKLADEGNVIGCHTRDHTNFRKLKGDDWQTQINLAKKELEEITGKPVDYFAFPFGYWNQAGLPMLHQTGFKAAFQLEEPRDPKDPIMTIRRLVARGYWSAQTLNHNIKNDFGR